jgi:large subunit ribosomal protein L14e
MVNWSNVRAKKIDKRAARSATSDFDRFKIMVARKQKSRIVGKSFAKAKKAYSKK